MKTLKMSLVMAAALVGCSTWATTFYVPAEGTLQGVINRTDCLSGDEIEIAAGTYSGDGYLNVNFWGKNVVVRSADPDDPAVVAATVIDCQNAGRAFVLQNGETAAAQVAGLTIINGKGSWGGGIYVNAGSSPAISRCVISGCAGTMGGAIGIANASPTIERCQLAGNSAVSGGGAIYITGGSPVIKNCIIHNNTANSGGGAIYSQNPGNPVVSQCTITDNVGSTGTSTTGGGAIWCWNGSNVTVNGSILWGNSAAKAPAILVGGALAPVAVTLSYCDVQGLSTGILIVGSSTLSGVGNIEADPMFEEGNWRLTEGSLCIDTGDPAYVAGEGETDVYGNPRVWGAAVDIGAAEYYVDEVEALTAQVRLWPKVINLRGKQNFLFCTIKLEDHESEEIDGGSIRLEGVIEPIWAKKFKSVKELVVRFDMEAVAAMVMDIPEDTVTLTVTGALLDGTPFEGSDTLKIYERKHWRWSKQWAGHIKNNNACGKDKDDKGKDKDDKDKNNKKGK